jgi:peptide/nickel transport system ATP-binding protein
MSRTSVHDDNEVKTPFVRVQGITKWYPHSSGKLWRGPKEKRSWVKAVDNVSFDLSPGEILGVIGESGCGKSTLGRMLCRLEKPTQGDVLVEGVSTEEMLRKDFRAFRRTVQMIFQNPFDTFTPRDTIGEILMRPLRIHHIGADDNERRQQCLEALESGGLHPAEDIMTRYPHELSGGQLQRVSIIRSTSLGPRLIVADEPVSMLDVSVRADIINMLVNISRDKGNAMVFISHDIAVTRNVSDRIAVMYLGRVVEYGPADEVVNNPQHPYTQALISNCTSIDPDDIAKPIPILGEPPTPVDPGPGCYFAPRCFRADSECAKAYPGCVDASDAHWCTCHRACRGVLAG